MSAALAPWVTKKCSFLPSSIVPTSSNRVKHRRVTHTSQLSGFQPFIQLILSIHGFKKEHLTAGLVIGFSLIPLVPLPLSVAPTATASDNRVSPFPVAGVVLPLSVAVVTGGGIRIKYWWPPFLRFSTLSQPFLIRLSRHLAIESKLLPKSLLNRRWLAQPALHFFTGVIAEQMQQQMSTGMERWI